MKHKNRKNQYLVAGVLLIMGFLIAYQYKQRSEPERTLTVEEAESLLQEIEVLQGEKSMLINKNEKLLQDVKNYEKAAASISESHALLKEELDRSRLLLGQIGVKGKGVTLTLKPTDPSLNPQNFNYLTEIELIYLINELKFAGAEAVSVNEKRITIQSGIQSSANNSYILINDEKISPREDIIIKAIGDPAKLTAALAFQGVLSYSALEFYDTRFQEEEVLIPKYNKPYITENLEEDLK